MQGAGSLLVLLAVGGVLCFLRQLCLQPSMHCPGVQTEELGFVAALEAATLKLESSARCAPALLSCPTVLSCFWLVFVWFPVILMPLPPLRPMQPDSVSKNIGWFALFCCYKGMFLMGATSSPPLAVMAVASLWALLGCSAAQHAALYVDASNARRTLAALKLTTKVADAAKRELGQARQLVHEELAAVMAQRESAGGLPSVVSAGGSIGAVLPAVRSYVFCATSWQRPCLEPCNSLASPLLPTPSMSQLPFPPSPPTWTLSQTPREYRRVLEAHHLVQPDQKVCHIIAPANGGAEHPDNYCIRSGETGSEFRGCMQCAARTVARTMLFDGSPRGPTATPPAPPPRTDRLLPPPARRHQLLSGRRNAGA